MLYTVAGQKQGLSATNIAHQVSIENDTLPNQASGSGRQSKGNPFARKHAEDWDMSPPRESRQPYAWKKQRLEGNTLASSS